MNQITPEWIAQQRALCEAATPGPWRVQRFDEEFGDAGYWERLVASCNEFVGRWTGKYTQYASKLSGAIFDALEDEYRAQENKPA